MTEKQAFLIKLENLVNCHFTEFGKNEIQGAGLWLQKDLFCEKFFVWHGNFIANQIWLFFNLIRC